MHLDVHDHAVADLDQLWQADPAAAAAVEVVIEQLEADPNFLDKLTTRGPNSVGKASKCQTMASSARPGERVAASNS